MLYSQDCKAMLWFVERLVDSQETSVKAYLCTKKKFLAKMSHIEFGKLIHTIPKQII